jgi:hypothetical protein
VTLGLLDCTGCCDEGIWLQAATDPAANKAIFNLRKRRKIVIIGILTFSATIERFNEFFIFDNTERSVFALLLALLVFGNHLIPALTPFSRICLELIRAVKQRHRALAEKRYTRNQGL